MGGRAGKSLDSFSSCLDWAGLWAQSVVWSPVIAAVVMIHPSGFLGKENELGKCFFLFFFPFSTGHTNLITPSRDHLPVKLN